jgi:decaprenyl-phosphate phosphoribosyltransferase
LVNDVLDARDDRVHPKKRYRPVARGDLRPSVAAGSGVFAMALAVGLSIVIGPSGFTVIILAYLSLSFVYSVRLKREPVVELAIVATGFILRAISGGVVAHVQLSSWFLLFTSFAALFLVTGKRYAELLVFEESGGQHRAVLNQYTDSFLRSTLIISATVAVASYCLWAFDRAGLLFHAENHVVIIRLTVVPLVLAVLHILRLLDSGQGGEPEEIALKDHVLHIYGLLWVGLMAVGLYA